MCDGLTLPSGAELRTLADLRHHYDVRPEDSYPNDDDPAEPWDDEASVCYCCVDVEAILDRAGAHWARDFTGWWWVAETAEEADRLRREWSSPARLS